MTFKVGRAQSGDLCLWLLLSMTLMVRPWTAAKWPELVESGRAATLSGSEPSRRPTRQIRQGKLSTINDTYGIVRVIVGGEFLIRKSFWKVEAVVQ